MIEKIDYNQIQNLQENASSRQSNPAGTTSNNNADAALEVNYASLINEAMNTTQTDTTAVQQAQELLSSGQLESEKNTQEAAENIINFGI
ncbi:MAG: hypothetical protein ACYSSO_03755 [Planctomycetota bacterium]|jgi:hypothetical protein